VFVPRETRHTAQTAYPEDPARATPGLYGTLLFAPIVVDDRIRVYAAQREVWADEPVDIKASLSPFWSYRRWPAEVLGVVAVGTTVVSRWTDGEIVALTAQRGTVAWRVRAPTLPQRTYTGRRTGANSVYDPVGLYTAGSVVVVAGQTQVAAYDAGSGRLLWTKPVTGPCGHTYFTGPDVFVTVIQCRDATDSTVDVYASATGDRFSWPVRAGPVTPFGCAVGVSGCRGVRTQGAAFVIGADGALTAAPTLGGASSWLVGDVVVSQGVDGSLRAQALDGAARWSWPTVGPVPPGTRVVASEPGAVYLLTGDRVLIAVDTTDGLELDRVALTGNGNNAFDPGYVYAKDRFVFMERLRPGARPTDKDSRYYYPSPNIMLIGA
jgi:outer membrane protein assembly factor BamB